MVSFVSYENFVEKGFNDRPLKLFGAGAIDELFKIGDVVDSKLVNELVLATPPLVEDSSLLQLSKSMGYTEDEQGNEHKLYLTFTFDGNDWIFRGACHENSVMNRAVSFNYAEPSLGEYCVDKFYSEYVRAVDRLHLDEENGVDVEGLSVLDDYMQFNVFSLAGYWIDGHGNNALDAFKKEWAEEQDDKLYQPICNLIEQKDEPFRSVVRNKQDMGQRREVDNINDLISNAQDRSNEINSSVSNKENVEIDM